jgi:hypothetical protein
MCTRIPIVVVVFASLACATTSHRTRLDPREVLGRPVSDAIEVPIEVDGDRIAVAHLACGGAFATHLGPAQNVVHFRLRIRNLDAAPLTIPVAALGVDGVAGSKLQNAVVLVGQETQPTAVEIPAGVSREVDVVFGLPSSVELDELTGFTLTWSTESAGHRTGFETSFAAASGASSGDGQVARAFDPVF